MRWGDARSAERKPPGLAGKLQRLARQAPKLVHKDRRLGRELPRLVGKRRELAAKLPGSAGKPRRPARKRGRSASTLRGLVGRAGWLAAELRRLARKVPRLAREGEWFAAEGLKLAGEGRRRLRVDPIALNRVEDSVRGELGESLPCSAQAAAAHARDGVGGNAVHLGRDRRSRLQASVTLCPTCQNKAPEPVGGSGAWEL